MIVHASIDENGKAKNGSAGDQTGKEVCTRSWYSKPWTYMLRYRDANVAAKAVAAAVKLAKSNLVGYDQNQRNTLYTQLVKYGWDVDKYIASGVKTETDCSAFVYACYCIYIPALRASGNAPTTSTMRSKFLANGFTSYTGSYLTSESKLIAGDILLKPGSHVVMEVGDATTTTTTTTTTSDYTLADFISDSRTVWGVSATASADTILSKTVTVSATKNNKHAIVKPLEKYFKALGYYTGSIDGVFGSGMKAATKLYQKNIVKASAAGQDGELTAQGATWKKLYKG